VACLSNEKVKKRFQVSKKKKLGASVNVVRRRNAPALGGDLAGRHLQVSPNNEYLNFLAREGPMATVSQGYQVGYGRTAHKFTGLHESRRHGREIAIGDRFFVVVAGDALLLSFRVGSFRVGGSFVRRLFLAVGCPVYEPGSG